MKGETSSCRRDLETLSRCDAYRGRFVGLGVIPQNEADCDGIGQISSTYTNADTVAGTGHNVCRHCL